MDEKLRYIGSVDENGRLKLPGAKMRADIASAFTGKQIEVTIQRKRTHRSDPQNRYYWGIVVEMIRGGMKDMGEHVTPEQVHEFLKFRFLKKQKIDEHTGELIWEIAGSTAALTKSEFAEYIELCCQFAADFLGVSIPEAV